jgi:glutamate/aspartate transport system permease protein
MDVILANFGFLMGGLLTTLELAAFALVGGIGLGMVVGLARLSSNPWIYYPVTIYVNFLRNIPLILVIFWFYFVLPIVTGESMAPFASAVIAFIIFEATYFGEIFRAGYQTISKDLIAASYATGMNYRQTARYILIPIALRRMAPSLITQSVVTIQDTSLAFVIGLTELVRRTSIVDNMELRSLELYGFTAFIYFIICYAGSQISLYYEDKARKVNLI